jgi:hypothetical protein
MRETVVRCACVSLLAAVLSVAFAVPPDTGPTRVSVQEATESPTLAEVEDEGDGASGAAGTVTASAPGGPDATAAAAGAVALGGQPGTPGGGG